LRLEAERLMTLTPIQMLQGIKPKEWVLLLLAVIVVLVLRARR
jgi:hypothetical protein